MKTHIPVSLNTEHKELHAQLEHASKEPGALGDAAREVAGLLHQHCAREAIYAMPPLGLLAKIAWSDVSADMAAIVPLTRRLKAELPSILMEHRQIVAALERLRATARHEGQDGYARLADALILHAQTEEEVLYPAAIVVGEYVALKLGQRKEKAA